MTTGSEAGTYRPDRRGIIISEAVKLFNFNGFADTRLEDIGEQLGTAKTSISYHFKSKEKLLAEAYRHAIQFSASALNRAADHANGREAILHWVKAHAQGHADAFAGIQQPLALIAEFPVPANAEFEEIEAGYRRIINQVKLLLHEGQKDGSIGVQSIEATHFFLLNILHWLPRWLAEVRVPDHGSAIRNLVDVLDKGIAADPDRKAASPITRASTQETVPAFNREARNRMKREAFLRTGTRALNSHGFRNLSLNEVAAELGVTRGAFYYHIADKDALLRGCFERTCTLIETSQKLARKDGISGLDVLERSLRWLFERQFSDLDPLIRLNLMGALEPKSRILLEARLKKLRSEYADIIASGMVDDSIRTIELAAAEHLIMGAVFAAGEQRSAFARPADRAHSEQPDYSSYAYFEPLFHGLAGRTTA